MQPINCWVEPGSAYPATNHAPLAPLEPGSHEPGSGGRARLASSGNQSRSKRTILPPRGTRFSSVRASTSPSPTLSPSKIYWFWLASPEDDLGDLLPRPVKNIRSRGDVGLRTRSSSLKHLELSLTIRSLKNLIFYAIDSEEVCTVEESVVIWSPLTFFTLH